MMLSTAATNANNPNNDMIMPDGAADSYSCVEFTPIRGSNFLLAGAWDGTIRCWDVTPNGGTGKVLLQHDAPVLAVTWMNDGKHVFGAGCDNIAKMWDLETSQPVQAAAHDAPIKCMHWLADTNLLVTAGWDKVVKYWDVRQSSMVGQVAISERAYASDSNGPLLVIAKADTHVSVFDIRNPQKEVYVIDNLLKHQLRAIACFPDQKGFAVGSVEGRTAISHFGIDPKDKANFSFKCHRPRESEVYAVNCIRFSPMGQGFFATSGSDGILTLWDKENRQKVKAFNRCPNSIPTFAYNAEGSVIAYACSYDWSQGAAFNDTTKLLNAMFVHPLTDADLKKPTAATTTLRR